MSDFDRYLAEVAAAADRRRPMKSADWCELSAGIGIPLLFLLLLVAFAPR